MENQGDRPIREHEGAAGQLFVVSLPIGNLEDITLRALRVLREVDRIVAEDTRHTRRLLTHFEIRTPFFSSLYQGAERHRVGAIVAELERGTTLALVSDAGTPLISDPGFPLVRAAIEAGIQVIPVPGPSAGLAALVASGLPPDQHAFVGSLPRKPGERRRMLTAWKNRSITLVAYESPHRLLSTLELIAEILPTHTVALGRELTKAHEEYLRGSATELHSEMQARGEVRGECVLIIGPGDASASMPAQENLDEIVDVLRSEGVADRTIVRVLAKVYGLSRSEAYRHVHGL